jgi:alanyl-tRNA synthetase
MSTAHLCGISPDLSKTADEVRRSFLDFFASKGHTVVPSGGLVPSNDPTLLFANAGMVQFKDCFTGKEKRAYTRAASAQKCIRISGKHNDLENVGVTARHHTFFEMLGNFSFGDYFKEEAIAFAWELVTKVWQLPLDRVVVTVFGGDAADPSVKPDDEARAIWKRVTGLPDERIIGMGLKDNFWQMGETGPCGPCSELHFFLGPDPDLSLFGEEPDANGRGWVEFWNLVFMQFERRQENGAYVLDPLPAPCVDTGAGLERIAAILQNKLTNYDNDLLRALVDKTSAISGKPYGGTLQPDDVSMRVIADHARLTAFLIAEGIFPDRAGREYVLRRVMRRAIRHGHRLGITKPFLHEVALEVVRRMAPIYPELANRKDLIASVAEQEEVRFRQTIDRGLALLEDEFAAMAKRGEKVLGGAAAFKLYDTYGFPLDLTEVIVAERGLAVDLAGYEKALEEARAKSEGSKVGEAAIEHVWREVLETVKKTSPEGCGFCGYEREVETSTVLAVVVDGQSVARADEGQGAWVVLRETPFYGESGGQVGDSGMLIAKGMRMAVYDTQKPIAGIVALRGSLEEGSIAVGQEVEQHVDHDARSATRRNHSATHLLHWALRSSLGETATQKGSRVSPEGLRFDFSHGRALEREEIEYLEDQVNAKILENAPITTQVLSIADAKATGAMAIFEEKYGDVVRVLTMTEDSVELCGGTHASRTGDIGVFKIVSDSAVAAGVRRIEAVTGLGALAYLRETEHTLDGAARTIKSSRGDLVERLERMAKREKDLEKEIAALQKKLALGGGGGVEGMIAGARALEGGKALAARIEAPDANTLREVADQVRDKLGESVVLLAAVQGDKVAMVVTVTKALTAKFKAGDLVKELAPIVGGKGGGRPDMAQAGGAEVGKVDDLVAAFYTKLGV